MKICTIETFMMDAIHITGFCPVCCRRNSLRIGWVDCHCDGCGNYFSSESPNRTVKKRRELLGLTRKEMSRLTGLSGKTIAKYENKYPSKRYWIKTQKMIHKKYNPQSPGSLK